MRLWRLAAALILVGAALPLARPGAQEAGAGAAQPAPSFDELQAMIARMQRQIESLGAKASERDEALRFLERQVEQAAGEISGTGETAEALRGERAALSSELETLSRDRDRLASEANQQTGALARLEGEVGTLVTELESERAQRTSLAGELAALTSDRDRLAGEVTARDERLRQLESEVAALSGELGVERAMRGQLERELATSGEEQARTAALAEQTAAQAGEIQRLRDELAAAGSAAERVTALEGEATARSEETQRLTQEVASLRQQLQAANELLGQAETRVDQQQERIDQLDEELAQALRTRVEELEQYRSEFFGRLRAVLGERPDLRVVGDRFVFQSELLFESGSATLDPAGQAQLRELAATLKEVAAKIPAEVDWVLRVDGHTDRLPIRTGIFRSNWELSTARAISVVEFLINQGIEPRRLVAAGFGEHRPLDARDDEIGYRRNRRIEFKLTES